MSIELFQRERIPKETVVLPDNVYHSYLGEYFFGQTESFYYDDSHYAWGGLVNPSNSNVMMFLNAYTISNFSDQPITAEGWLSTRLAGRSETSALFAAGNQAIFPPRYPKVMLQSASFIDQTPSGGTYTFVRRVEPSNTLTKHDFQGMYIIPPGSSFILFFLPAEKDRVEVKLACGWWEVRINREQNMQNVDS